MATRAKACGCWRAPRSARAVAHRSRWSPPLTRPRSATGGMGAAPGWWASWCAELVHASRSRPRGGALQPSPTVEASQRHARRIAGAHVKTSKTLVSQFYQVWRHNSKPNVSPFLRKKNRMSSTCELELKGRPPRKQAGPRASAADGYVVHMPGGLSFNMHEHTHTS